MLTVNPDGTVTRNAEYYTLGHLARFVKPGAVRIASTSFGTTGWNGQVMDVAFRNPDGSTVLVAHNENDNPQTFAVREGRQAFTYTLPGGALATFVWHGSTGSTGLRPIDPTGWTATANPAGPTDPCCSGDVAANAVDDDASTRYSSGTGQAARPVPAGRLRPAPAGPADRLRHRRLDRRLPAWLHASPSAPTASHWTHRGRDGVG